MIRYGLKTFFSHLRENLSLFFLTVAGVALGVASVLAVQIVNDNSISAFSAGVRAVSGEADLSVLGRGSSFSEELYPRVLSLEGVAAAWPIYRIHVAVKDRSDLFLEIMGVDFFSPLELPWTRSPEDVSKALFEPGWVAVNPSLARQMGWSVGDSIQVTSGTHRARLQIGALVDFQTITPLASPKLAVMDIAQAQSLLGQPGRLHQIDIRVRDGTAPEELISRLESRLGESVRVLTPGQRRQEAAHLTEAFRLNLTALSLISLLVGLFLIHTSTQAALVRRRFEFGLLRSLGATRVQILFLILGEVTVLGFFGVLIGLPLGYWVAEANIDVVSSTLTNLYLLSEIGALQVPPWHYLLAVGIGLGGALTGAFFPAFDMSRKDTKSLLSSVTLHEKVSSLARPLFLAGCALLLSTGAWYWLWGRTWKPAGFVLAIAVLLSLPLLSPFLMKTACGGIRVRGFGLRYSLKSLIARLSSTAFTVSALAIAVSMLVGITFMIGSFRRTVETWVASTVQADVYVTTPSWQSEPEAFLTDRLVKTLSEYPGVRFMDRLRKVRVLISGYRVPISGVDMLLPNGSTRFPLLRGDRRDAFRAVREDGAVLIGEPLARKAGLDVGDHLTAYGPTGSVSLPIAGIYYDYSSEFGSVAMDLSQMNDCFGSGPINGVSLYLEQGRNTEEMIEEIRALFPDLPLRIRSNRRLRQEIFKIFDQTFALVRILQFISLLIAVFGIMLSLLVLARELISELALYRALGARRWQIFRVFVGKGFGLGIFGLGMGTLGGIILAAILIFVINRTYFGWTIQLHWPGWTILGQLAVILAAAVAASLYPAFRATNVPAGELSRDQ